MKWTAETAVHFLFWERKDRENGPISEPVVFCEGYIRRSKMIAVEIENIKRFMAGFLAGDLFDDFLMNEGKLSMDIAYEFNGKVLKEFYDTEEWEEYGIYPYIPWEREKARMFGLIKGKKTPLSFQFVMMLKPEKVEKFLEKYNLAAGQDEIAGLFINLLYDRKSLKCTSGVSRRSFTMDRGLEEYWDVEVKERLKEFM